MRFNALGFNTFQNCHHTKVSRVSKVSKVSWSGSWRRKGGRRRGACPGPHLLRPVWLHHHYYYHHHFIIIIIIIISSSSSPATRARWRSSCSSRCRSRPPSGAATQTRWLEVDLGVPVPAVELAPRTGSQLAAQLWQLASIEFWNISSRIKSQSVRHCIGMHNEISYASVDIL